MALRKIAVEVRGVSVVRGGRRLLDDVSFEVCRGETAAVIGANGSGKSTLLRVLEGYEFPTRGVVRVLGDELGRCELARLRERVRLVGNAGMSSMGGERLDFAGTATLLDVVLTGSGGTLVRYDQPTKSERRACLLELRKVGLSGRETVQWGVASAGERTRTLLARARLRNQHGQRPQLLLLDEPTANLDPAAREETLQIIDRPPRGTTQLVVTHHVEELPRGTGRVLVLKQGKVIAWGDVGDVVTSKVLSEAFSVRMKVRLRNGRRWAELA